MMASSTERSAPLFDANLLKEIAKKDLVNSLNAVRRTSSEHKSHLNASASGQWRKDPGARPYACWTSGPGDRRVIAKSAIKLS